MTCIFCEIVARRVPATIVHADSEVTAFRDINPQAPTHILVVPNRHIESIARLTRADGDLLAHMIEVIGKIAEQEGIAERGYRVVANHGEDAGQSVAHLHLHLLGGRRMGWPPG
jgi:histidine triad (HIT) family protein